MTSKFSKEGYLLVDHRESPGVPEELTHRAGLPPGAGKGVFEAPSYTCTHCTVVVIMRPDRRRDRAYCSHCDAYICDRCGAVMAVTGKCVPFKQLVEEIQEAAAKGLVVQTHDSPEGIVITTNEV